jgi:hypothetical protein
MLIRSISMSKSSTLRYYPIRKVVYYQAIHRPAGLLGSLDTSIKANCPRVQLSHGNLKNCSGSHKEFNVQNKQRALDLITSSDPLELSYDWPEFWFNRPFLTKCSSQRAQIERANSRTAIVGEKSLAIYGLRPGYTPLCEIDGQLLFVHLGYSVCESVWVDILSFSAPFLAASLLFSGSRGRLGFFLGACCSFCFSISGSSSSSLDSWSVST